MPELPDITIYIEALDARIVGQTLEDFQIVSPFLLRTFEPDIRSLVGKKVTSLRRLGKRIAVGFEDDLWFVLHLMIAGRLHWKDRDASIKGKMNLAAFRFSNGSLILTEAGSKRRASLHVVQGEANLKAHDPGGIDLFHSSVDEFSAALTAENRTLKRALTNPQSFSGIGNAYSDEILHRANLSPIQLTKKLTAAEIERLHGAIREIMQEWIDLLREAAGDEFPEGVTAFRPEMAVHGKFGKPCPVCGAPVQRIRYADNETNYCARCQTGGKVLADRSLSRLLKDDWPRSLEEWE
jgi:formamidopyrimidine-DNA glycosylase